MVCVAKPGTGKTTVALACAQATHGKTLVLTYNRKLKESTRERIEAMRLGFRRRVPQLPRGRPALLCA